MDAGSGTQLQNGLSTWIESVNQPGNIIRLGLIILISVKQIVVAGIVGKYRCAALSIVHIGLSLSGKGIAHTGNDLFNLLICDSLAAGQIKPTLIDALST